MRILLLVSTYQHKHYYVTNEDSGPRYHRAAVPLIDNRLRTKANDKSITPKPKARRNLGQYVGADIKDGQN